MEELYQKYQGQVNFLWAYAREAHPEENPFAEGFETRDLGWDHRYFETTTMEERARRARWMKTDLEPDAEIPMIIDFINSELGPDNAIWQAYTGGGFYAGFVIDCDATIVYEAPWAWASPGGEWWGLLLRSVEHLESFLDSYLADPPPCYDPGIDSPTPEPLQGPATILIVDDDDGSAYEGYFRIPLGNLKAHYHVWNVQENGSPSSDLLANYNVVVWFTGDASQDTLTATDQANLATYLDGGGKLFLSGQDIGLDIGDTPFFSDYLHAALINDDVDVDQLMGADIFTEIQVAFLGPDGAGNQDSPSHIGLLDEAVGVFAYDAIEPPAWAGLRWQGDYQLVYLAFGFEGIGNGGAAAFRFEIMSKVLAWFDELPCPGDLTGDCCVDQTDLGILLAAWDTSPGDPGWDPVADIDENDHVSQADLGVLLGHWGAGCP